MKNTKKNIDITKLHPFENHPYKVQDNEEMERLAESIKQHGVLSPIIVRPLENMTDEYEIISGHRRVMASRKAGITEIPGARILRMMIAGSIPSLVWSAMRPTVCLGFTRSPRNLSHTIRRATAVLPAKSRLIPAGTSP